MTTICARSARAAMWWTRRALVIPGLVDAHVHLSWYAHFLHNVDRQRRGRRSTRRNLSPSGRGAPLPARGSRGGAGRRIAGPTAFPTAAQLDAVVPDHPVYLEAQSAHAAWVNLAALRQAGITAETPDPPGGRIGRDASGQPTGVLFESAMGLVKDRMPEPDAAQMAEHVRTAITRAQRGGLTGVHDFDGAVAFQAYQLLQEQGALNFRIVKNLPVELLDHAISLGLRWGFGDDFLRIGGVKMFADGALGPRTAWMVERTRASRHRHLHDGPRGDDGLRQPGECGGPAVHHPRDWRSRRASRAERV